MGKRHRPSQELKTCKDVVEPIWKYQDGVLFGNGSSLSMPQILEARLAWIDGKVRVLGCNNSYMSAPWIDVFYGSDLKWWRENVDPVRKIHMAMMYTGCEESADRYGLHYIQSPPDPNEALICLAVALGLRRLFLLGYDDPIHFERLPPGVEIINCSPATRLEDFPTSRIGCALA